MKKIDMRYGKGKRSERQLARKTGNERKSKKKVEKRNEKSKKHDFAGEKKKTGNEGQRRRQR